VYNWFFGVSSEGKGKRDNNKESKEFRDGERIGIWF
jgi:hypothetical protein